MLAHVWLRALTVTFDQRISADTHRQTHTRIHTYTRAMIYPTSSLAADAGAGAAGSISRAPLPLELLLQLPPLGHNLLLFVGIVIRRSSRVGMMYCIKRPPRTTRKKQVHCTRKSVRLSLIGILIEWIRVRTRSSHASNALSIATPVVPSLDFLPFTDRSRRSHTTSYPSSLVGSKEPFQTISLRSEVVRRRPVRRRPTREYCGPSTGPRQPPDDAIPRVEQLGDKRNNPGSSWYGKTTCCQGRDWWRNPCPEEQMADAQRWAWCEARQGYVPRSRLRDFRC